MEELFGFSRPIIVKNFFDLDQVSLFGFGDLILWFGGGFWLLGSDYLPEPIEHKIRVEFFEVVVEAGSRFWVH